MAAENDASNVVSMATRLSSSDKGLEPLKYWLGYKNKNALLCSRFNNSACSRV